MKTKEVFNAISILYDGVDLTSLEALHTYGEYICGLFDDDEKHVASLLLHTGSEYYQVIAVVASALKILLHSNTDMDELLQSLQVGDLLLVDGQRAKFLGVKDGSRLGIGFLPGRQYFCIETGNGASKSASLEQAKRWNISRYQGDAVGLGGKGVKDSLEERRKFIACFCGQKEQKNVSTEINSSIAVLADRDFAERVYKKVSVTYSKRTVPFSKLVTAAYVSENESYQIGSNPVKEEAIIKFYSKISSCRNDIIEDKERRIAACIACSEKDWILNSEIHDIADRRSLRVALLLGRTHYTDYREWLQDDRYKVCAIVPEIATDFTHGRSFFDSARDFNAELGRWARHRISTAVIDGGWSVETEKEIKRNLLSIKNECFSCESKDLFLISAYFLLNLCRTAFFPLKYCDKAFDVQSIPWKPSARFDQMTQFMATLTGEMKSAAENVYNILREAVNGLYEINPKGQFLLSRIQERKVKHIVTPKAYYRSLMNLWLNDMGIAAAARPQIITTNELHSSEQCYDDVIFVTPYFDLTFNPYAELSFSSGEVVCYAYEQLKERKLKRLASYGQRQLRERNWFRYDLQSAEEDENTDSVNEEFSRIGEEIDDAFEAEMEQLSRELQMQGAKKYVSGSHTSGDGTIQIATIVGFASGSIGFFTKYYKAYVLRNESIDEIGQDDLKVGDSIVFTKETENKDIVDTILLKLFETTLSQSELHRQYLLSRYWKEKLKSYIGTNGVSYREFARQLGNVGCQKHEVTVRSWLYEESHVVGPFDAEDYEAMDKIVRFEYSPAEIKEACDAVRSLRRKVLGLLAKAIIRRMSSENSDPIWDSVLSNAENLSQIEQIISINSTEDEKYILTVTPDSDGSTMATVSCKKAFGSDTIIITVTTREGGYTATCTVSFKGIASGIEITSSTAAKKSTSARGEYYELGTSKTYTFDIGLTNVFDDVASDLTVTEIGGEGTMYFGSRYSNGGGYYNYQDVYQKSIGELADKFITSATISGTTLTIKTGSSVLENYYSEYAYDEYDYYYAKDAFLVELDDYWNIKGPSDTFYNDNSKYNAQNIGSCYFYVTVKDNVSGLSETVRLWLVSSVSGVSLSETELEF